MSETIIAALIAASASIIVSVITSNAQKKTIITEFEKNTAVQAEKIDQLDRKVEKHNKVIERVYNLETQDKVEQEQIKVINHRIDDLEGYHK